MLVSKNAKIYVSPNAKPKICVTPDANPQRKSVEYRLHWVPNALAMYIFVCVLISFAFGSERKHNFQGNMGCNVVIFLNILFFAGVMCHPSLTIQNSNVSNAHGAYGAVIQVGCMQGYTLTTQEKLFSVLCQEDGEWNTTVNRCDRKHRGVSLSNTKSTISFKIKTYLICLHHRRCY